MEQLTTIGIKAKDAVLWLAGLLKEESSPGIVVVALTFLLVVAVVWMRWQAGSQVKCIRWLFLKIKETKDPKDFTSKLASLDNEVTSIETRREFQNIAHAWREYRETLIPYDIGDGLVFRNSVRPSTFFNLEDLHFGPGFFKVVPGLFVSFGLFLTFLGLISALGTMGNEMKETAGQLSSSAMATLLTVASAKFIMSLTGLACSIIFTVFLRHQTGAVDRQINQLNLEIERRLTFISLELIGIDQLKALKEQKDHFKAIGMEMVAELGRPLREELPIAISTSISGAITPLIQNVREANTEGIGSMVEDLSKRLSSDVGTALESASQKLVEAGRGIEGVVNTLNQSSGHMGSAMEGAIERLGGSIEVLKGAMTGGAKDTLEAFSKGSDSLLATMNTTLAEIARNTGDGAKALNEASEAMGRSAIKICSELEEAARRGSVAAEDNLRQASQSAGVVVQDAGNGILEAFAKTSNEMGAAMEGAIERLGGTIEALKGAMTGGAKDTLEAFSKGSDSLLATMNITLAEIARNTGDGAKALSEASEAMSRSVAKICGELEEAAKRGSAAAEDNLRQASHGAGVVVQDAGNGILEAFAKASAEIGDVARKMTDASTENLLSPLAQLSTVLKDLVGSVGEAARHTQAASQGMQNGADAANSAAGSLRGSAQILNQASNPIAVSVQAVQASTRALENSTANIAESSRSSAESVARAIKSVSDLLAGEQAAIQSTLKLLSSCIERMRGQGDRLDEMDDKLGNAFEGYRTEVQRAMDSLEDHVRKIQEQFTPALSTLHTLVEQIEEFAPSSRRK